MSLNIDAQSSQKMQQIWGIQTAIANDNKLPLIVSSTSRTIPRQIM